MNEIQRIMNEKKENNIKNFSLDLHFVDVNEKQPSKSGYYYIYTQYGAIQSVYYSKKYNLWNAMDDYIDAAFNKDMVLYWIDGIGMDDYIDSQTKENKKDKGNNKSNNKTNKIEMTFGEIASKLLLAYYMGKLNKDENNLNKIATMNNKELTKNLVDKGQLINWE